MVKKVLFLSVSLLAISLFSQNEIKQKKDSIKTYKLDEVVVVSTGQHSPQSVKKSVYDVSVIKNKKILRLAATNLEDVLRQSLNLNVLPNVASGRTDFKLFGLDGEYVKILVDNIPLVNDRGLGNNADLSQINLEDVEQIEVVEGSMAVEYGANAVAGVINIVTKKRARKDLQITTSLLEETIGSEYELFDKGKHNQSVKIMANLTDDIFTNLTYNRNHFAGFYKDQKGKHHYKSDGLRGHHWLPKEQHNVSFLVGFNPNNWNTFYKFSYMNDEMLDYNKVVNENYIKPIDIYRPFSRDKEYTTERFYHHINLRNQINTNLVVDVSLSYQLQQRDKKEYTYYIKTQQTKEEKEKRISDYQTINSIGSVSYKTNKGKVRMKLAYDIGFDDITLSGLKSLDGDKDTKKGSLNRYDAFGFVEYDLSSNLSLRGGTRVMFSELFDTKLAYNLSAMYKFDGWQSRLVFGNAPRNPNFTELYYSYVDNGPHNMVGNENLKAEKAISLNASLKKTFAMSENLAYKFKVTGQYLDTKDRITWITIPKKTNADRDKYTPINIDKSTTYSGSINNTFYYDNNLEFSLGGLYQGNSQKLNSKDYYDGYLYTLQLNSSITYKIPSQNLSFSLYSKYNGKEKRYSKDRNTGNFVVLYQKPYSFMDASISKGFINNSLKLTFGAKNITNVTQIESDILEGQTHSAKPNFREFSYGRSYFAKLTYNIY